MRAIVLITLIVSLLGQSFNRMGWMAYYYLNQDYIAKQLCENRDRPELKCNGQCFLMKKLKAEEEKPGQPVMPVFFGLETAWIHEAPAAWTPAPLSSGQVFTKEAAPRPRIGWQLGVFRPPVQG
jgi:hypothetical protein